MGALAELKDRLTGLVAKIESASAKAGSTSSIDAAIQKEREVEQRRAAWSAMSPAQQTAQGLANRYGSAGVTNGPSQRALDAAVKAETRARNAATKALEAEAAEKRALLPKLRAESKLEAFAMRTEEQKARAYQASSRLGIGQKQASGDTGGIGGMMGAAKSAWPLAAAFALKHELDADTRQINIGQRADLTEGQRTRLTLENTAFVGGFIKSIREFSDAINGTTERVRALGIAMERQSGIIGGSWTVAGERQSMTARASLANMRVSAFNANPYSPLESFDRMSVGGLQDYTAYQRRLPALDAATRAARESSALYGAAQFARARAGQSHNFMLNAEGALSIAQHAQRSYRGGNRAILTQNAAGERLAAENLSGARSTYLRDEEEARRTGAEAIRAEQEARRSLVEVMGTELQTLREREARIRGNTGRFGSMNPAERQQFQTAAQLIERYGIGNIPVELQQMAARGAPDWVRQQQQQFGETTPEYQWARGRGMFGGDRQSLADIHAQEQQVQANIRLVINLDEGKLAQMLAENYSRGFGEVIRNLEAKIEDAATRFDAQQHLRSAQE